MVIVITTMQCLGRIQSKGDVFFEAGPRLHRNKPLLFSLPKRCEDKQSIGDLCDGCNKKCEATKKSLEKRAGKYIPNQACLLHGKIIEPIPDWSRLYKGIWWLKQIEAGYILSPETKEKAENAFISTHKDVDITEDMKLTKKSAESVKDPVKEATTPKRKMTRKKIGPVVAVPAVVAAPAVVAVPVPPEPIKKVKKSPVKKSAPLNAKSSKSDLVPTLIITNQIPIIPTEVVDIEVERAEIDGHAVWLDKKKDKVYDLKYNYIGRKKDDTIDSSFPDSDRE